MAHVEIYILNYNGVGFLPPCLEALRQLDPGSHTYHVNVIDNGSTDNSRQLVSEHFKEVSYIALNHNHGFSRGNNLGVWERTAQLSPAQRQNLITVFLNNDTAVHPGWLKHAADVFEQNSKVGIVGSKSIFFDRFAVLDFEISPAFSPREFGAADGRELGVFLHTSMRGDNCFLDQRRNKFVGFYSPEGHGRWSTKNARLFLAIQDASKPSRVVLTFENHHAGRIEQQLRVRLNENSGVYKELVLPSLATTELELELSPADYVDVVQNAGSYVNSRWEGGDRGFLEIDRGQFDQPQSADSICGVSMFIRHELFAALKGFDENYFAYYEDTDLSLRARLAGYSLVYEPRSVLRHIHCGSGVEYSDYFNNNVIYSHLIFASKMMSPAGWRAQLRSYWARAAAEFGQYEQDKTLSRKPHLRAVARLVKTFSTIHEEPVVLLAKSTGAITKVSSVWIGIRVIILSKVMQNNQELAVSFEGVSKVYKTYRQPADRLKEALARGKKVYHQTVVALEDVSFEVPRGVTFGVVGRNGSGKSTVLQIIAGVLQPSCGHVQVSGRVSALLELGSGFNPEFSGIDNIYLYASILGLNKDEVDRKLQGILDFADIGDFVHQPVKIYSSGMVVRLAFSVAVAIDPEILIVDEALSVGDALFQHKCIMRMREIMSRGATVIFVSHDLSLVKALTRAVLLEKGRLVAAGSAEDVARAYQKVLFHDEVSKNERSLGSEFGSVGKTTTISASSSADSSELPNSISASQLEQFRLQADKFRLGTGEARVVYVEIVNSHGEVTTLVDYGERFAIRLYVDFYTAVESAVVGFNLRNDKGEDVIVSNSHIENLQLRDIVAGERIVVQFELENILRDAHYSLSVAATSENFFHQVRHFDWVDHAVIVRTGRPVSTIVYGQIYPTDVAVRASRGGRAQIGQTPARASNEI